MRILDSPRKRKLDFSEKDKQISGNSRGQKKGRTMMAWTAAFAGWMSENRGRLQIDCECPGAGTEPCQNAEGMTDQSVEDALSNTVLCHSKVSGQRKSQDPMQPELSSTLACSSAYKIFCIALKARARWRCLKEAEGTLWSMKVAFQTQTPNSAAKSSVSFISPRFIRG